MSERKFASTTIRDSEEAVGITLVDVEYAVNTLPTKPPVETSNLWKTLADPLTGSQQLWTRTKTTYSDGNSTYSTPANITPKIGATGQGVESITEQFYLSNSKTTQTGSSWKDKPDEWVNGKFMWTRSKIVYKNPSDTKYTEPLVSSEWEAINELEIGGRNYAYIRGATIYVSNDFPRNSNQQMSLSLWGNFEEFPNVNPFNEMYFSGGGDCHFLGYRYTRKSVNHIVYEGGYVDLSQEEDEDLPLSLYGMASESLITKVKIEIGNKATDWAPAPEDVQDSIDKVQADANVSLAKTKGFTQIGDVEFEGGLIFTSLMKLLDAGNDGEEMAGISGIAGDDKEAPAFWAGGTYDQAVDGTAKAIIRHDGSSKFTDTEITGTVNATSGLIGGMIIKDGNLISTRGKSYDGEEIVYGEYTKYQFNTSPLVSPPSSSHETWTDLPSTTNTSTYIQYKKNTETQWTQVRVGISSGRWIVKYAETPNASIWYETFAPNRIWMQIKVGGEPTARKVVKIDITSGYDFIPNLTIDGARGTMKITGEINATSGAIGGMKIEGGMLVSQNGKVVVDGISNQIYLKDEDSDDIRTILSPSKLPLTPSSYFGSSSTTDNVSLGRLEKTYSQNADSVDLVTIPSGDSSAYQISIPPITMSVNVSHPGGGGGIGDASLPNIAEMRVEIYKGGIPQYNVSSVWAMSTGQLEAATFTNEPKSYTIQGSGTWSVRVTHTHTINTPPSSSEGRVMGINGNAVVAKVVNSSAIGSNGMIIATSGTEYTYMVGDTYEVRRNRTGFKITPSGVYKSSNMDSSNPTWNPI